MIPNNKNYNSFAAYPKETIRFYNEFIPDKNLSNIIKRIRLFNDELNIVWIGINKNVNVKFQNLYNSLEIYFRQLINVTIF